MENNVDIVKDAYARFGEGDIPGLLGLLSEDVHWSTPTIEGVPLGGVRSGHAGAAEFFRLLNELEETTKFEPREFIAQGDRVAVLGSYGATVRETGRSYEVDWAQFFGIRDGKIASFDEFYDSALVSRAFQKATSA